MTGVFLLLKLYLLRLLVILVYQEFQSFFFILGCDGLSVFLTLSISVISTIFVTLVLLLVASKNTGVIFLFDFWVLLLVLWSWVRHTRVVILSLLSVHLSITSKSNLFYQFTKYLLHLLWCCLFKVWSSWYFKVSLFWYMRSTWV